MTSLLRIKQVIPVSGLNIVRDVYAKVNRFRALIDILLLRLVVLSPGLSSLYYFVISAQFRREQHATVYGRYKYYQNLQLKQSNPYLLRRNIHRLEKGLIMQPRRDVFATGYIAETVDAYCHVYKNADGLNTDDKELNWASDVLSKYFQVVGSHPTVNASKEQFFALSPSQEKDVLQIPYKRNLEQPVSVSYSSFLELCQRRRSVRWYLQKPVPRELLDQAVTAAALSPSACNRQPFEFRIFDNPNLIQKVASIPGGTKGFHHNFPVIIAVVGKLSAYFHERDRHVIYIDGSLASMSLMYALETLDLSSCAINWPDVEQKERAMENLLSLEPDERVIMLISAGYPDPEALVPYSSKKPLAQIRQYN